MSEPGCPFCSPDEDRIFHRGLLVLGLWDGFPVSPGHALLITRRHVASFFEASAEERRELIDATFAARESILAGAGTTAPDGFNLGVNIGAASGQTVFHLHLHVIPRYAGDAVDPRGGVSHCIPGRGNYFDPKTSRSS